MTNTLDQLSTGIKEMLALEEIDVDTPLAQVGIDSFNVVELIIICQQIYTNVINYEDLSIDETTTLRDIDEQMTALSQS